MSPEWNVWIAGQWQRLAAGAHIQPPVGFPHPIDAGFARLTLAEPHGQTADYSASLADGSRIHLHEYADGTLLAHRDAYDPVGVVATVKHLATETAVGPLIGLGLLVALVAYAVGRSR